VGSGVDVQPVKAFVVHFFFSIFRVCLSIWSSGFEVSAQLLLQLENGRLPFVMVGCEVHKVKMAAQ